jgi:hypothetical protein
MAAQQPSAGQPASLERTVHRDGAQRIRRTTRVVATDVPVQRTDHQPVRLQETDEQPLHVGRRSASRPTALAQAPGRSERKPAGDVAERGSARTTKSVPIGVVGIRSAASCRSRRLTRFLATALPIAFETTTPTRTRLSGTRSACNTSVGRVTRTPNRMVRWKSAERVIRAFLGSTGVVDRFRRRAFRGPCGDGRPQWLGLLVSASEDGNHGYGYDAGCSAGTCAYSRESSHNWLVTGSADDCRSRPWTLGQRPSNGTGPRQTGQTGAPPAESAVSALCPLDTPRTS